MVRKSGWLIALSGLVLCLAVVFFWYSAHDRRGPQDNSGQGLVPVAGQEPITPIPLDLKLDTRKVMLGRRLFHDPRLSHDNTVSCSTCHDLAKGVRMACRFRSGSVKNRARSIR